MDLKFRDDHLNRIKIISLSGNLDAYEAPTVRKNLLDLIEAGSLRFVIDLSNVDFMDSAGMAVLVNLLKRTRQADGDICLVWPKEEAAQRILKLTRFDRIFQITSSVPKALLKLYTEII
jgi:anti-sigma B factor antagonist